MKATRVYNHEASGMVWSAAWIMAPLFHFEKFFQFLAFAKIFLFFSTVLEQKSQLLMHLQIQLVSFVLSRAILRLFCTCVVQELLRIKAEFRDAIWSPPIFLSLVTSLQWLYFLKFSLLSSQKTKKEPAFFSSPVLPRHLSYLWRYLVLGQNGNSMQCLSCEDGTSFKSVGVLLPSLVISATYLLHHVQRIELSPTGFLTYLIK